MVMEEIKRVLRITIIAWVLFAGYAYEYTGNRDLFEYFTYLLMWGYVSLDIRGSWKHFITVLLVWNILEEASILSGTQFIDGTMIGLMVLMGLSYVFYKKSVMDSFDTGVG